jgi:hypothetical protein
VGCGDLLRGGLRGCGLRWLWVAVGGRGGLRGCGLVCDWVAGLWVAGLWVAVVVGCGGWQGWVAGLWVAVVVGCGGWQGWVAGWVWVAGRGGFVLRCSKYTM